MAHIYGASPAEQGIELFRAGKAEEAAPLLRQAIQDEPDRADLHMWLGMCMGKREKWADAQREFEKAADLDGSSADYAFYAGVAMVKQGRLREANSMFHVALLNNPNHPKAKQAFEQTKAAAAQVTTDGSSAAMPGGLSGIDLGNLEMDLLGGSKSSAAPDPVASALGELQSQQGGKGGTSAGKKTGCGGGIMLALGLLVLVAHGLAALVS